jgi:hypothetical protein
VEALQAESKPSAAKPPESEAKPPEAKAKPPQNQIPESVAK